MTPENAVKAAIIEYLQYNGWLVMRINAGAVKAKHTDRHGQTRRRFFNFVRWFSLGREPSSSGISDIIAIKPGRMPLAVETKAPGKLANVSEAQQEFGQDWQRHGGVWLVVDSLDMLVEAIG